MPLRGVQDFELVVELNCFSHRVGLPIVRDHRDRRELLQFLRGARDVSFDSLFGAGQDIPASNCRDAFATLGVAGEKEDIPGPNAWSKIA